jgi:hypothetical protein
MKTIILSMLCLSIVEAAPSARFWRALHLVETGGRHGPVRGDGGRALGPLQIHRSYWMDSRVGGRYEDCASLAYSVKVASAYMKRYAPNSWRTGNLRVLARIHNGGPKGYRKASTLGYWRKVERRLNDR